MSDEQHGHEPDVDVPAPDESQPEAAAATQVEWTPVAPPHPYQATPAGGSPGRAFAIWAMAIGLVALLSAIVSTLYFADLVYVGGVLGIFAVILAIVALVKKQRPVGAGVVGLASGAFAVCTMAIIAALGVFSAVGGVMEDGFGSSTSPTPSEETLEPSGTAGWPANMATGGLLFESGLTLVTSDAPGVETAPQPLEPARAGVADMRLYVDYRCPICSIFEQTNGEVLEMLVDSGAATLEIVPLTFLDRVNPDTYYSSRAAGAMACIADSQPEVAWQVHTSLLDPRVQPSESVADPTNDELLQMLETASGGLTDDVRACVLTERFVPFAGALSGWVFQNPVPFAEDAGLMVQGTPTFVVNGVAFTGSPNDAAGLVTFLQEQGL